MKPSSLQTHLKKSSIALCLLAMLFAFFLSRMPDGVPTARAAAATTEESALTLYSAEDLRDFSRAVNEGERFVNTLVTLEADISLEQIPFTPIGLFGTSHLFYGTFDGKGHTISGLYIDRTENMGNNGLFGQLAGTVQNLHLEGYLEGNCVGGIASHCAGNAKILNCSSSVVIRANRGGGIADNFNTGEIVHCRSDATSPAGDYLPLVSYTANVVYVSSSAGLLTGLDHPQNILDCLEGVSDSTQWLNQTMETLFLSGELVTRLTQWQDNRVTTAYNRVEHAFQGEGTLREPYLISSLADYAYLRLLVNEGDTMRGVHFRQTCDLSFEGLLTRPMGYAGSKTAFYGVYDGYGHTMEHLLICGGANGGDNALFGSLGGIVMNLGLESGRVTGNCCASFAVTAASSRATLVNCYSRLDVSGFTRSGGLVDNFEGYVVGCWYDGPNDIPLVSYNAILVTLCKTSAQTVVAEDTFLFTQTDNLADYALFADRAFAAVQQELLPRVAAGSGVTLGSLFLFDEAFLRPAHASDYAFLPLAAAYPHVVLAVGVCLIGILGIILSCKKKN